PQLAGRRPMLREAAALLRAVPASPASAPLAPLLAPPEAQPAPSFLSPPWAKDPLARIAAPVLGQPAPPSAWEIEPESKSGLRSRPQGARPRRPPIPRVA